MCDSNRCASDVLPHDFSDIRGGIGVRRRIVSLSGYTESDNVCDDGRCYRCGYDRGVYKSHTEVEGFTLECHHCETRLMEVDV